MSSHPLKHTLKWHLSPPFQQNCCKVTCDLPVAPFNDHFTVLISSDPPGPYTAYLPFSFLARLASLRCWVSALSQFPPTSLVSASQYSLLIPPQIFNSQTLSAPWLSPRDVSAPLLIWIKSIPITPRFTSPTQTHPLTSRLVYLSSWSTIFSWIFNRHLSINQHPKEIADLLPNLLFTQT